MRSPNEQKSDLAEWLHIGLPGAQRFFAQVALFSS
jgi:hypothetical protein